jgi:hypothetical protein
MKNTYKLSIGCVALASVLGGCATSKPALHGQLDPTLGSAVKANIAAHAVAPTAEQKANTFIPADPTRTQQARQNYRDNKVPEPQRVNSSEAN